MHFRVNMPKKKQPKEDPINTLIKDHMNLIEQGLEPELIYDGHQWVYGIKYEKKIEKTKEEDNK